MTVADRARTLLSLHTAPEVLVLANVWDVASARVVAATEGATALATASLTAPGMSGAVEPRAGRPGDRGTAGPRCQPARTAVRTR